MMKKKNIITIITIITVTSIIIYFNLDIIEKIYKARYPIYFENEVTKYDKEYNLDPYLIYSIIRTESSFDKKAVSKKDARGLMQIMPSTGKWIAQKMEIENFHENDLFIAEKNIMMGIWYFNYLLKRFDNDINLAIIAYNAGPGKIESWLNDEKTSSDGTILDSIPFEETERYEKKIIETYEIYKKLYNGT
jgi:soluble lytic murein transglycosylase